MRPGLPLFLLLAALTRDGWAQRTRAERTEYRETSSHADVLGFLDSLRARGAAVIERFAIDSVVAEPPFEGLRPLRVEGRWLPEAPGEAGPGWFVVQTDQRLAVIAGYLLEPASEDGVATWDLLAPEPAGGESPVLRSRAPVHAPADPLP